ncbi:MAG: hypothetical protein JWP44_1193 [Mucilaginibacter sp.]|nr:hypothetical protein [Mucilaginibacter sp.]
MVVFSLKMAISFAPVFLSLNSKTITAVITELELDGKTDKDNTEKENPEKDLIKDKKFFDENMVYASAFVTILTEANVLHNQEHSLYIQQHHPVVPTPPPNI